MRRMRANANRRRRVTKTKTMMMGMMGIMRKRLKRHRVMMRVLSQMTQMEMTTPGMIPMVAVRKRWMTTAAVAAAAEWRCFLWAPVA